MSVFVHAQSINTVHEGGLVKKWQNSVHVVVECPLEAQVLVMDVTQTLPDREKVTY